MAARREIWEEYGVSKRVWMATAGRPRNPKRAKKPIALESVVWASVLCEEALSDLGSFPWPKNFDEAIEIGEECLGSDLVARRRIGHAVSVWMRTLPIEQSLPSLRIFSRLIWLVVIIEILKFAKSMSEEGSVRELVDRAIVGIRKESEYDLILQMRELSYQLSNIGGELSLRREEAEINDPPRDRRGALWQKLYVEQSVATGTSHLLNYMFLDSNMLSSAMSELGEGYAMRDVWPINGFEWEDFDKAQDYFDEVVIRNVATNALNIL